MQVAHSPKATPCLRPLRQRTPSGTPRRRFLEHRKPEHWERCTRAPAAAGPTRAPASALTWPVMPVMRATFLGLPISPSPEPRALGQRAGACAMSLRACGRGQGRAKASGAEAAAPEGRRWGCARAQTQAAGKERSARRLPKPDWSTREVEWEGPGGWTEAGPGAGAARVQLGGYRVIS